jgi:hypothetical protein
MRSTSCGRSRSWTSSVALGAAVTWMLGAATASAGEKLSVEQLVDRASGAAVVKVRLGRGREADTVQLVQLLDGLPPDTKAEKSWFGLCLPDRKSLRGWTVQYSKWPARVHWRRALARGHYTAVVLVGKLGNELGPECGVEAMQMVHTDLSPDFAGYQKQVVTELRRRRK